MVRPEARGALASGELFALAEMAAPVERRIAGGRVAVFSARSPVKRTPNEDAALLLEIDARRAVLAVADGVGGYPGGERAARLALEHIAKAVRQAPLASTGGARPESRTAFAAAILAGIEAAHAAVLRLGGRAATTLALAELDGRVLRTYHAGDSGVLVASRGGRIQLATSDHSPVGHALAAGLLAEREALVHRDRHLISNALGVELLRIEVGTGLTLAAGDTLLVASDGLFGSLRKAEIARELGRGSLAEALGRLVARVRAGGAPRGRGAKPDDLTLVAFRPAGR